MPAAVCPQGHMRTTTEVAVVSAYENKKYQHKCVTRACSTGFNNCTIEPHIRISEVLCVTYGQ